MRVLVTGSRDWDDRWCVYGALNVVYDAWRARGDDAAFVVIHGGARGADTFAADWAHRMRSLDSRIDQECHLADWHRYGRAAGHRRNKEMVDTAPDICLAFPLGKSPGTRGCMRLAKKAGITVRSYEHHRKLAVAPQ